MNRTHAARRKAIDDHFAVVLQRDARLFEPESVGCRAPSRRDQNLIDIERRAVAERDAKPIGNAFDAGRQHERADRDAVALQDLGQALPHVLIEPAEDVLAAECHGDRGAQPAEDRRELECDVAGADAEKAAWEIPADRRFRST